MYWAKLEPHMIHLFCNLALISYVKLNWGPEQGNQILGIHLMLPQMISIPLTHITNVIAKVST